jgi:hypothetical protein
VIRHWRLARFLVLERKACAYGTVEARRILARQAWAAADRLIADAESKGWFAEHREERPKAEAS